jgi:hypothetical protein
VAASLAPLEKPLAWVGGGDRLLLDDITPYGLRRLVYARKGDLPDVESLMHAARRRADGAELSAWLVERDDGYWYLWVVWMEPEKARQQADWNEELRKQLGWL